MGPSKSPNSAERAWMARIAEFGCICCYIEGNFRPAAVHHITRGKRLGHMMTIPLCEPGHHKDGASVGMVSFHDRRASFEALYGTEFELLERVRGLVG